MCVCVCVCVCVYIDLLKRYDFSSDCITILSTLNKQPMAITHYLHITSSVKAR